MSSESGSDVEAELSAFSIAGREKAREEGEGERVCVGDAIGAFETRF